jgi:hypothetical protein
MQKSRTRATSWIIVALLLAAITACSSLPALPTVQAPAATPAAQAHVRKIQTSAYVGDRDAIILTVVQINNSSLKDAVDGIIRVAGDNRVPIDVALPPLPDNGNYNGLSYLRDFVDAGAINVSFDGNAVVWLDSEIARGGAAYDTLIKNLARYREQFRLFFGNAPVACILPDQNFTEGNYAAVHDGGFDALSAINLPVQSTSVQLVSWAGKADRNGLYRLPIVAIVDYTLPAPRKGKISTTQNTTILSGVDKKVQSAVDQALQLSDLAVVEILPSTFLDNDGKVDPARLSQLSALIKSLKRQGDITTFYDWNNYASRWAASTAQGKRVLPPYNGGPAIIFRLDDVAKGWHEDVDKEIILLFEKNGIPVDLGVVSNVDGTDSYDMPWLKEYVNKGVAGISVHGYDWDFYQLDTATAKTDYADIKFKLRKARDSYAQYFGVNPVSLTVPTDSWDRAGYLAVQDAGYKIFSTHISEEPHPSIDLVDVDGRKDPSGMYRIPTASDVCEWDETALTWGKVIDVSKIAGITDYCKYYQAYEDLVDNEIGTETCSLLNYLGVAAITIHPDAFVDKDGKVDKAKLAQIQPIITWIKKQATVTTFEQWYNYTSQKK